MNLILLTDDDFTHSKQNRVQIADRRFDHIKTFYNVAADQELPVGVVGGKMGVGKIVSVSNSSLLMDITVTTPPPEPCPTTLICALPRPKTARKVVQCATALGIKGIYFINSWRVEKSYWQSPLLEKKAINNNCILGLEQACDTIMPTITLRKRFKPFVEDELPDIIRNRPSYVFHPYTGNTIRNIELLPDSTIIIGPEGGFNEYEIRLLTEAGCTAVSAGKRILRVEYAIPYILGNFRL